MTKVTICEEQKPVCKQGEVLSQHTHLLQKDLVVLFDALNPRHATLYSKQLGQISRTKASIISRPWPSDTFLS